MRLKTFMLLSGLAIFPVASTRADLAFVVTPAVQSDAGSNEVFFIGTLTNTSLTDNLFLNNIQFAFTNAATNYLTADTNAFFANVPGILLPGEIYHDVIFGIVIATVTPHGDYFGTVTIQGGTNIFSTTNLSSQTFQISLTPVMLAAAISGSNIVLSWPSPPGDFVLQQNSDLATTNWTASMITPASTNGQNQAILSPTNGKQFYRLKYP